MFIGTLPVSRTIKLLITKTGSVQKFVDRPGITHEFCNEHAVKIMRQDGFAAYADILTAYIKELNLGVIWADKDWKNISHYYIPGSGGGLWHFSNALEDYTEYFQRAVVGARSRDYRKAAFYLGAAAHLVQDMCVPHHARGVLFKGHSKFESWAETHRETYAVDHGGLYGSEHFLLDNALVSADLFAQAAFGELGGYQAALTVLLPLSQRSTAGLFEHFFCGCARQVYLQNFCSLIKKGTRPASVWPCSMGEGFSRFRLVPRLKLYTFSISSKFKIYTKERNFLEFF